MRVDVRSSDPSLVTIILGGDGADPVLDGPTLEQLLSAVRRAAEDPACRALVLRGQPGQFCRGMDLRSTSQAGASNGVGQYADLVVALREAPMVVLAEISGEAIGGGVGLAAAADIAVATAQTTFALPELHWGLMPAMVLPLLLERISPQRARLLALQGTAVDAAAALTMGLIDQVVEDDLGLERARRNLLRQVFRQRPASVSAYKRHVRRCQQLGLAEAVRLGRDVLKEHLSEAEVQEAIGAFVAGELPSWFSRPPSS